MLLSVCLGFALFGNKFLIIQKKKKKNLPKLPRNTFECLAQSEEECPSEVAKSKTTSRSEDFSDTSPIIDTFKHIKRVDELRLHTCTTFQEEAQEIEKTEPCQ